MINHRKKTLRLPISLLEPSHHLELSRTWDGEKIYFRGDDYFRDLLRAVERARLSVDFESYLFEGGVLGSRIVSALARAANRGVRVRLLVDGVGSPDFADKYGSLLRKNGIQFRVYRSWRWFFSSSWKVFRPYSPFGSLHKIKALWTWGTHRDHRKLCVVDGKKVWLGGFNVSDWHLEEVKRKSAWRDTGIGLDGVQSLVFSLAFHLAWEDPVHFHTRRAYRKLLIRWISHDILGSPIRVNVTQRLRRRFQRELIERFRAARRRIWITTPYFVPTRALVRALTDAARRGCDVRLLLPGRSDVPMVHWASITFYPTLLKAGCRVFEYLGRVLHAKTQIVDDWALVGSSNLDYRSLSKDLEINVIPKYQKSVRKLERQFGKDQVQSKEYGMDDLQHYPLWARLLSWFFFRFRFWF